MENLSRDNKRLAFVDYIVDRAQASAIPFESKQKAHSIIQFALQCLDEARLGGEDIIEAYIKRPQMRRSSDAVRAAAKANAEKRWKKDRADL